MTRRFRVRETTTDGVPSYTPEERVFLRWRPLGRMLPLPMPSISGHRTQEFVPFEFRTEAAAWDRVEAVRALDRRPVVTTRVLREPTGSASPESYSK